MGVRKDDDELAVEKLTGDHEENAADADEIPDPEEIGEEIEVRGSGLGLPGHMEEQRQPLPGES